MKLTMSRKVLLTVATLGVSTAAVAQGAGSTASQARPHASGDPVLVIVPEGLARNEALAGGCWARLYEAENFAGPPFSVIGPLALPNTRPQAGFDWGRRYDSLEVGPRAVLVVYDQEDFRVRNETFTAGQRVADLDRRMAMFEKIRSLRLQCTA